MIFTSHLAKDSAQGFNSDVKTRAAALSRKPGDIAISPGLSAAVGSAEAEAPQVWEELDDRTNAQIGLARLSARFCGHDFASKPLDTPLARGDFADPRLIDASKTRVTNYIDLLVNEGPAVRQLLKRLAEARGHLTLARTPEKVADVIEDWFASGTADGFNIMPPLMRCQFEILTGEVVPLLQKRGLFRRECQGST